MSVRGVGWTVGAVLAVPVAAFAALTHPLGGDPAASEVALAPIVAEWPDHFVVTGTKSEPLYTELIDVRRDGDVFALQIDVLSQGDEALGSQSSAVRVSATGAVEWTSGCVKSASDCADDPALRGFLETAALLGLERRGLLPERATERSLHGTPVVCVDDALVHPDAAAATVRLDPCFDTATGAVLGHWSPASAAFVGATLADGFTVTPSP